MKTILQFLITLLAFSGATGLSAQDLHFSQFYMSPLALNPAMPGAQHDLQTAFNYKNQWQSIGNPYKTMAFSFDMRVNKNKVSRGFLAAGVNFFSDKAGDAKMGTTQGNLAVAYHVRLNASNTLGAGIMTGFAQRSMNFGALKWGNQYDGTAYNSALSPDEPAGNNSFSYLDLGAGIDWNFDNLSGRKQVTSNHDQKFNLGVALFHVNQPKYSFYATQEEKLYMKTIVHGTGTFSIVNSNVAIVPGFMYARQGPAQEIYAGSLIRYVIGMDSKYTGFKQGAAFSVGAYMRAKDAVAATMLLEYANYALGVSYDVNTSSLRTASNARGGFEISLRYVAPNPFTPKTSSSFFN